MEYFVNEFPELLNEPWRSFPFEWYVDFFEFSSEEIREWLDNNMKWQESTSPYSFLFSCEEDAMAFKLRWV